MRHQTAGGGAITQKVHHVVLRRVCRDHERLWHDICVDRNLDDGWLAQLNELKSLRLINICEGHPVSSSDHSRRSPQIILRLREQWLPGLGRRWDVDKMAVLERVNDLFRTGDTEGNLEAKFQLRWGRGRLTYLEDLTFRVRSRKRRTGTEMDAVTRQWFEDNVARLAALDGFLVELWPVGVISTRGK
jgi:hypothetical protein